MPFDIYPYNYWIFYAAIALLVISLILSAVRILGEVKKMKMIMPAADQVKRNLALMQIKTEVLNEKKMADAKKNKIIMLVLPVLLAIYNAYQKDDTAIGAKGYVKATKKVLNQRSEEQKLIRKIAAAIR